MTWRKWWALEVMSGLCIILAIAPLSFARFWLTIGLVALFSVCYLKRVLAQAAKR